MRYTRTIPARAPHDTAPRLRSGAAPELAQARAVALCALREARLGGLDADGRASLIDASAALMARAALAMDPEQDAPELARVGAIVEAARRPAP